MSEPQRWWTAPARSGEAAWVVVVTLAAFLARLPVFFRTFASGDEATYSALAAAMLDGQWLYVGAVDHKPPLIASTYALVVGLAGPQGIHAVHAVSILVVVATGLLFGLLARRLEMGQVAARAASVTYVLWASIGPGKDVLAANGELLMALPAVGALVIAWPRDGRADGSSGGDAWRWMVAGALVAVATLFKYQAAAIAAPLAWLAFAGGCPPDRRLEGRRFGRGASRLAAASLGGLVVLAALVVPYWRRGELQALVFWAWAYPLRYAGSLDAETFWFNAAKMSGQWLLLSAGPLLAVAPPPVPYRAFIIAWIAGAAVGVASGGRFFLHYYLQLLPPLAIVAGLGVARLIESGSKPAKRRLVAAAAITGGCLAASWGINAGNFALRPDRARHDAAYRSVGAHLRSHSEPGDGILVWGNSPEIYYYAARPMGTRFPFCNYQSGKIWGTPADEAGARVDPSGVVEPAWQMLLADIERRRPAFVVDAAAAGLDRWEGHEVGQYPRLAALVREQYRPVAVVDRVVIYARRDRPTGAAHGATGLGGAR